MTEFATKPPEIGNTEHDYGTIERVIAVGDLARMTPDDRARYYVEVCRSVGLNPLTQPFQYISLNQKLVLYARKDATDQLRALRRVSLQIVSREVVNDVYVVTARATMPDGRADEEIGAVPIGGLKGEAYANAIMKAGCVPMDSEILTRDGFKSFDDIAVGDEVLAYDVENDQCVWTPLRGASTFARHASPLVELRSRGGQFRVRCTLDHSWAVEGLAYRPDGRGDGSRGARGPYRSRRPLRRLVQAGAISTSERIVLAAPETATQESLLLPVEAAVLGWAVTDGTIKRVGNSRRIGISQSKEQNFPAIRELVEAVAPGTKEFVSAPRRRTFPTGNTSDTLPQHWWYIPAAVTRAILERAGFHDRSDLPAIVTRLSSPARKAMLQAFMLAEGTARGTFFNTDQHLLDAFQMLCALEGIATGKQTARLIGWAQRLKKTRHVAGNGLERVVVESEEVWCPTTDFGTWVMRQGGRVMITGNTKAKRRVTLSICGLGLLDDSEVESVPGARRVDDDGVIEEDPDPGPSPRALEIKAAISVDEEPDEELLERRRQAAAMNPPNERARTENPQGVPGDDVDSLTGEDLTEACLRMRRALNAANVPAPAVPKGEANMRVWWRHCAGLLSARP